ncbi:hypothetical protein CTI12_AA010950 [Artemisia annua]|uniref:Uncharacterized protein n=1 Tax=Artemisia annua TaxID=35608 RepID=A0A2U1QMJ1_ARTAN|nr:hypothetical protein CTI12_AA010950 [Artemisia annua]
MLSSQQTVMPHDELLPRDQFLPIKRTNHIFCPDSTSTSAPVMVDILRGHPIFKALTISEDVPEIYVQQFWNTLTYNTTVTPHKFEGMIENFHVAFTLKQFREMFDLKKKNDFTGKDEFDDFTTEEALCVDIVRLGYGAPLPKASAFRRKYLSQLWATLFSIINRCLTSKSTGMDQCSISVLRIFQGIAFNKNYDYAGLFWNDLIEVVKDKNLPSKARKFVPFIRFLKIVIFSIMRDHKEIPRRPNDPSIADFQMKYLRRDCGDSNVQEMRIPDELLAYADQTTHSVIEYRNSLRPNLQPKPEEGSNDDDHEGGDENEERFSVESEKGSKEKGGHLHSSPTTLSAQSSMEPSKTMSTTLESNESLREFAGTSAVVPNVGILRRSESTVLVTEPLSEPGVNDSLEFVSREYLDGALKAVQESFAKQLGDMQQLLGKLVATEETILPPPPPPQPQQQDLSVDELKQLLLAKLLSQSEDESANADFITILRKQCEVSQNIATKEDATNSKKSLNDTLEKLSTRVATPKQSYRSQAHGLKRRHDDHDHDHHEGEKRKRLNATVVSGDHCFGDAFAG